MWAVGMSKWGRRKHMEYVPQWETVPYYVWSLAYYLRRSSRAPWKWSVNIGDTYPLNLNIIPRSIANKYLEGNMKSTLKRGLKEPETVKKEVYHLAITAINTKRMRLLLRVACYYFSFSEFWRVVQRFGGAPRLETRTKESDVFASGSSKLPSVINVI